MEFQRLYARSFYIFLLDSFNKKEKIGAKKR
nr:MAG TPA_asm: Csm1 subunit domain B [Caudoviricetes sp.]